MQFTYDLASFSDLYKESHGFRPGQSYYEWMDRAAADELQAEWDYLLNLCEINLREEQREQAEAKELFLARIKQITEDHNVDVKTCIRWMHDAEDTGGDNFYLDYKYGVKYGTVAQLLAE